MPLQPSCEGGLREIGHTHSSSSKPCRLDRTIHSSLGFAGAQPRRSSIYRKVKFAYPAPGEHRGQVFGTPFPRGNERDLPIALWKVHASWIGSVVTSRSFKQSAVMPSELYPVREKLIANLPRSPPCSKRAVQREVGSPSSASGSPTWGDRKNGRFVVFGAILSEGFRENAIRSASQSNKLLLKMG
jgi:hypothetical protein